jgi:hypothetical protein
MSSTGFQRKHVEAVVRVLADTYPDAPHRTAAALIQHERVTDAFAALFADRDWFDSEWFYRNAEPSPIITESKHGDARAEIRRSVEGESELERLRRLPDTRPL